MVITELKNKCEISQNNSFMKDNSKCREIITKTIFIINRHGTVMPNQLHALLLKLRHDVLYTL